MLNDKPTPNRPSTRILQSPAVRISLLYFVVGAAWILLSDTAPQLALGHTLSGIALTQTLKGWFFVTVTASGLYLLLRREFDARQRSEQLANTKERHFRTLFANNPLPMIVYDRVTLRFLDVNDAACAYYGYTHEEFAQLHITEIRPPEDIPRLMESINSFSSKYKNAGQWTHLAKDGHRLETEIYMLAFEFQGQPAVLSVVRDVSEQKRAEAERLENERLRLRLAKEDELQTMRRRFTSMVSHEFRRPLTTITTSIELLEHYRGRMTEEAVQKHFGRLHEQLDEMKELLDDFLILMRAETGMRELKLADVNLGALCASLIEELRPTAGEQHPLQFHCSQAMETIRADEKLLRQAISNLLTNAIKYSPAGGEVRLEVKPGSEIEIHVSDQGIGIPPQDLPRLFEPFYRASNVGDLSGTGLGLSIARQAAEAHGGSLQIARTDASGTEFVLTLPAGK